MSSQESREARQKRIARQALGAEATINYRRKKERREETETSPGPSHYERTQDPWADGYAGEEVKDEEYFIDNELNFEDGA